MTGLLVDLDSAELARPATGGDLDVAADADAEQPRVALLAAAPLLAAPVVVADAAAASVERGVVVAGVVGERPLGPCTGNVGRPMKFVRGSR